MPRASNTPPSSTESGSFDLPNRLQPATTRPSSNDARVLEDQITIGKGERTPHECPGEASAGSFWLASDDRSRPPSPEISPSARTPELPKETKLSGGSANRLRTRFMGREDAPRAAALSPARRALSTFVPALAS